MWPIVGKPDIGNLTAECCAMFVNRLLMLKFFDNGSYLSAFFKQITTMKMELNEEAKFEQNIFFLVSCVY